MSMVEGVFSIECANCGTQRDFTADEVDFEGTGGDERGMGVENIYGWEETFNCSKCGNEIEIDYSVSEYPVGAHNFSEPNVTGGRVIAEFSFDFQGGPDEDYDEDQNEEEGED